MVEIVHLGHTLLRVEEVALLETMDLLQVAVVLEVVAPAQLLLAASRAGRAYPVKVIRVVQELQQIKEPRLKEAAAVAPEVQV
jgi:hypothetical protein